MHIHLQILNPNFQYYQYYQINPNFKIQKDLILDLGFWIYFGFGNIWILDLSS